jgi:hypothetical protein
MFSNITPHHFKKWYNHPIFLVDSDILSGIAKNRKSKIIAEISSYPVKPGMRER